MVRRFLRRFFFGRSSEVFVGHLQIVLLRDPLTVADPCARDIQRVPLGQFGLPRRPQVLKQLRPRLQAGPLDDPLKLRS
ncbi:MAG: hypothetical protein DCC67_04045 [Planctomycetota bacterium]|nr:MAG: hypothetical protein DCC67_04045 [Planctomycetota bacterium]